MINWINSISAEWFDFMVRFTVQNTVFISVILLVLYLLRNKSPKLQKMIALSGLVKLFIPPFTLSNTIKPEILSLIPTLNMERIDEVFAVSVSGGSSLNSYSFLLLFWVILLFSLSVVALLNIYFSISKIKNAAETEQIYLSNPISIKNLTIYKSKEIKSPYVIGLWHTYLFLPEEWEHWDETVRNSVIAHETAHIKEGDQWINLLKIGALLFHFFNPLVWLLLRKINYLSEVICDDYSIVENSLHPLDYNKHLLAIAQGGRSEWVYKPVLSFSRVHKMIKNRMYYQLTRKDGGIMKRISLKTKITVIFSAILMLLFSLQCTKSRMPAPSESNAVSGAAVNGVYNFFDVDQKPKILEKGIPVYPKEAKEKGLSGKVVVRIVIDEKGHVCEAALPKALPSRAKDGELVEYKPAKELIQPALDAAKKCIFKPAIKDGKAVKVAMYIPYNFKLRKKM